MYDMLIVGSGPAGVSAVHADSGAKNYTIRFKDYEGEILLSREKYTEIMSLLKERYAGINI